MVRLFLPIALAVLTVLSALFFDARLAAVQADIVNDCVKAGGDIAIRACTRVIEDVDARNLYWAYYYRGNAYEKKGDKERAIADYRKAIELSPGDKRGTAGLKRLGVTP